MDTRVNAVNARSILIKELITIQKLGLVINRIVVLIVQYVGRCVRFFFVSSLSLSLSHHFITQYPLPPLSLSLSLCSHRTDLHLKYRTGNTMQDVMICFVYFRVVSVLNVNHVMPSRLVITTPRTESFPKQVVVPRSVYHRHVQLDHISMVVVIKIREYVRSVCHVQMHFKKR